MIDARDCCRLATCEASNVGGAGVRALDLCPWFGDLGGVASVSAGRGGSRGRKGFVGWF